MKLKRGLYLVHRWFGIVMCLLLAMWFVSGVVLMYVHFPTLTPEERMRGLPALDPGTVREAPDPLLQNPALESLTLTTVLRRPAWLAKTSASTWTVMFADTGEMLDSISTADAALAARQFLYPGKPTTTMTGPIELVEMDQWTVSGGLNSYRPLFRVPVSDGDGTILYVSSLTGQVVRDTTRRERIWNWLGANLHWIYPLALRRHTDVWNWVVVILSIAGLVSIITGTIAGVLRLRPKRRYRGKDWTPYRGVMKWHHVLGLACSVFLCTFMLSGLLSMNPFGVFSPVVDYDALPRHYQGVAPLRITSEQMNTLRSGLYAGEGIREVRWHWLGNRSLPVLVRGAHDYDLLPMAEDAADAALGERIEDAALRAMLSVDADVRLTTLERLDDYDNYYYSHAGRWRPLPILRLCFDDAGGSWLHIDGRTGELLSHMTARDRAQRWLYHGLHSLDLGVLIRHRPAWDIVMLTLSALGIAMALTGVAISWKRLRLISIRGYGRRRRAGAPAHTPPMSARQ